MVDTGSKLLKAGPAIPDQDPAMVMKITHVLTFLFCNFIFACCAKIV